jgi:Icc-related predicted phosphoesterase
MASLVAVCAVALLGCPEKRVEPAPVAPPKVVAAAPAPVDASAPELPPAEAVEPRADKECAAAIDPGPASELKFGDRVAKLDGARLTFSDKQADGKLIFGVLGPMNEDSGENMLAIKKYLKFFKDEKADAILVTGDVGEKASSITRVLSALAGAKVPVLVVIGNRECRADFTDGVAAAQQKWPNVVNLSQVREINFPELTLLSLPGYHDANYLNCKTGCLYVKSTIEELVREARAAKGPVAVISHGPPHGTGAQSLDYAGAGGNVGDEALTRALTAGNVRFGFFSNIKEAGGRAAKDPEGSQLIKEGETSASLFLNPGPSDSTVGWDMNDGTKTIGMAAIFTLKDGQASWKGLRLKPLTGAEKSDVKKLAPTE